MAKDIELRSLTAAATTSNMSSSQSAPAGDEIPDASRAAAESQQIELDVLSKRFYYAGFLGLPWLWIVHVLNWHGKKKEVLRPDRTGA